MAERIERHNRDFARSHRCWFEALYKDKYEYLGEFDLMSLAFLLDLGLYYFGVVSQPFRYGAEAFISPPFSRADLPAISPADALLQSAFRPRSRAIGGKQARSGGRIAAGGR